VGRTNQAGCLYLKILSVVPTQIFYLLDTWLHFCVLHTFALSTFRSFCWFAIIRRLFLQQDVWLVCQWEYTNSFRSHLSAFVSLVRSINSHFTDVLLSVKVRQFRLAFDSTCVCSLNAAFQSPVREWAWCAQAGQVVHSAGLLLLFSQEVVASKVHQPFWTQ